MPFTCFRGTHTDAGPHVHSSMTRESQKVNSEASRNDWLPRRACPYHRLRVSLKQERGDMAHGEPPVGRWEGLQVDGGDGAT